MKVRCGGCGKVVKISESGPPARSCPECGTAFIQHQPETIGAQLSNKGTIPTQSKATGCVGLAAVVLVLSFFGSLASAGRAESSASWLIVGLLGVVAAVAIGVWFQNKSRKDKQ